MKLIAPLVSSTAHSPKIDRVRRLSHADGSGGAYRFPPAYATG